MTAFEDYAEHLQEQLAQISAHQFQDDFPWYRPGVTLEEAHETISQIPINEEWGIKNPTEPRAVGRFSHFEMGNRFLQIRLRELFEGYDIPHGDAYFIGLMGQRRLERDFLLWHDTEMREELIWPLFSLTGTQEVSFANLEKYGDDWIPSLIALEKEGLIDRKRLLDEILGALNRGFPAYRVRWFTQHYDDFGPTEEETTARQHLLIAAMGSGVASTTTFAVKQLSKLADLDQDGFVAAASHALGGPKGTAIAALKMLEKIASERDDLVTGIADAAQTGLYHSHDDVVRRSAKLLRTLDRGDLVDAAGDTLSPAMALELLGQRDAEDVPAAETEHIEAQPVTPFTDEDALFRTRELLAAPEPVGLELLVGWLAKTGPRALEILKPVIPKPDQSDNLTGIRSLLSQCARPLADQEQDNASVSRQDYSAMQRSLELVIAIVRGRAPTRTLLSTPTDTFGRVDNEEFARRLATYADPQDISQDDVLLAHLRLAQYQEETTGLAPVQGAQAGCHCFFYEKVPKPCDSYSHKNRVWERTVDGWQSREADHDAILPHLSSSPFKVVDSPAARAIVAPSCLDLYTYEMETKLDMGLTSLPEAQESGIVDVLAWHPGEWTPHTANFLGKAMAHFDPEVRAVAAEIVATKLAHMISAEVAAQQWAQIEGVILGRWAASLTDAATLNPVFVRNLLTCLLPRLDRKTRDIAKLIELLRNVRLRTGQRDVDKQLLEWLSEYKGKTKAATAAAAILKEAK